jgi:hypothetical protein
MGKQEAHIHRSDRPRKARNFPLDKGMRRKESKATVANMEKSMLKGSER